MPCNAILYKQNKCRYKLIENEKYCEIHLFFKNYTSDMLTDLIKCNRCQSMHYSKEPSKNCPRCLEVQTKIINTQNQT